MTASEVLPNPAGALITVRRLLAARSTRPTSRGRPIRSTGRRGGTTFVARKRCGPLADVSPTTRIFQSHIVIGGAVLAAIPHLLNRIPLLGDGRPRRARRSCVHRFEIEACPGQG